MAPTSRASILTRRSTSMIAIARETLFLARLAVKSSLAILVLFALVCLVCFQVLANREGSRTFGAVDGIVGSNASLRLWIPLLSALFASSLAATLLGRSQMQQVFLNGVSPKRLALLALRCSAVVVTATYLGLTIAAAVVAQVVRLPGQDLTQGQTSGALLEAAIMVFLIWLWAAFGATIGATVNSKSLSLLSVAAMVFLCLAIERVAVLFPSLVAVAIASPLGSSSVLLYGTFAPFFPQGRADVTVSFLILIGWAALFYVTFLYRYSLSRSDRLGDATRQRIGSSTRAAYPTRGLAHWLAVPVALIVVAVGYALPQSLNEGIPWRYKTSWLSSVAAGTTPADSMRALMRDLAGGRDQAAMHYVVDGAWRQVMAYRTELQDPAAPASTFDLLAADAPGTVLFYAGLEVVTDSDIFLPPQIKTCWQAFGTGWKLQSISADVLSCDGSGS